MMLDYDLGNPADAAAASMMLFGDDPSYAARDRQAPYLFESFGHHHQPSIDDVNCGFGAITDYFPQPPPLTAAALFSPPSSTSSSSCHQRYGLALPPAPTRLGLNLGVRTYFSSGGLQPEVGLTIGRVRRRTRTARCQAEGCGADLTHAKHYHRRHKVCEYHSKASIVIAAGLSQRFCQQCSRFHVLAEFDHGKRSCRKRLADHNRRRRKSQDLTATTINAQSQENNNSNNNNTAITCAISTTDTLTTFAGQKPEMVLFSTTSSNSTAPALYGTGCKPDNESSMNNSGGLGSSPPTTPLPTFAPQGQMELGLGLVHSSSSSTENSPLSITFLSQLGGNDQQRFVAGWEEAEDGNCLRGFFQ